MVQEVWHLGQIHVFPRTYERGLLRHSPHVCVSFFHALTFRRHPCPGLVRWSLGEGVEEKFTRIDMQSHLTSHHLARGP